ncbi:hypothetical protein NDN08_007488 [Rhodosorus marinus]|uniref:Integrase catalytic domain-containing protein n=1 Tax=Rhodosorus marinus TaxID=101924 RepID=A0AAV8UYZ5_9RHOD|nr:hypothetical protein NDN08_007488 [Rhodosorus marinus]
MFEGHAKYEWALEVLITKDVDSVTWEQICERLKSAELRQPKKEFLSQYSYDPPQRDSGLHCHQCGRMGYIKRQCWFSTGGVRRGAKPVMQGSQRHNRGRYGSSKPGKNTFRAAGNSRYQHPGYPQGDPETLLAFGMSTQVSNWDIVLDSGASTHMFGNLALMSNVRGCSPIRVTLADGTSVISNRVSEVVIRCQMTANGAAVIMGANVSLIKFQRQLKAGCHRQGRILQEVKIVRASVHGRLSHATGVGDIIHSDICGPVTTSATRKTYFAIFVDEYSRFTRVYFLRKKNEMYQRFNDYKVWFETQTGTRIKVLHTDGGGEYEGLAKQLVNHGIKWDPTAPHSPETNGFSERTNRSILVLIRLMLHQSGVNAERWTRTLQLVQRLLNGGARMGRNQTAHEVLYGRPDTMKNVYHFGCEVLIHLRKDQRKGGVIVYLEGLSLPNGNYEAMQLETEKLVIVRDVIIHPDIFPLNNKDSTTPVVNDGIPMPNADELQSLNPYNTWTLVERPSDAKVLRNKFAFKIKRRRWRLKQYDIKIAYLNGVLHEKIYMEQPEGYTDGADRVCQL